MSGPVTAFDTHSIQSDRSHFEAYSNNPSTRHSDLDELPHALRIEANVDEISRLALAALDDENCQTRFIDVLGESVRNFGNDLILSVRDLTKSCNASEYVVAEILKWLGDCQDASTYRWRRNFLEETLSHNKSPIVRDGANLGLAFMDDPASIPILRRAADSEKTALLKKALQITLDQLENRTWHS